MGHKAQHRSPEGPLQILVSGHPTGPAFLSDLCPPSPRLPESDSRQEEVSPTESADSPLVGPGWGLRFHIYRSFHVTPVSLEQGTHSGW